MSIYFQKNQEFYKKTQKILSIGTAAEFDFIQGEAGKYFPDYACSIPGDELPTHLNCPWESFSQQLCIPEKKKKPSKNTCWYTISSYFLYQSPDYI